MAVLYYESELTHHGVPKQKWYRHQFGDWEEHARYANGQPDPNGRGDKKPYKEDKKTTKKKTTSSSNTSSSVVSKASGVVRQFMVRQKKKAAAAKQRQYKKDLQERLAAATSSPEEMARFKKTATDAELRALQKRLEVYKALNKATPDALKVKPGAENKDEDDHDNEPVFTKEGQRWRATDKDLEKIKNSTDQPKQETDEEHGSASNLLTNIVTSNMKDELAEKAFHNLFKISKPSFSSQVARDKKLQKKLIKACESPKNLAAFKKAATNAELKALEERLRIIERTNKAIPDRLKSEADIKAAKAARKKSREDMSAAELKDLYERAVYLDQIERLERRKMADKAESVMNVVKYGPAIATAIDSGSTLLRAAYRLKSNKDVVDKINKGEQKEKGGAWTYKDIDAENARVLMGAVGDELGVLWKTWQNYNGGGGNQQGNKKDKNKGNPQQTTDQSNNDKDKDNND
jgi:uncharacterized protein YerC